MKIDEMINKKIVEMLSYCKKYLKDSESLYLYCSYNNGVAFSDFFMKYMGRILEKHEADKFLNLPTMDSVEKQKEFSTALLEMYTDLLKIAKSNNVDLPTEIKAVLDCKENSISFESIYCNKNETKGSFVTDAFAKWKKTKK